MVSGEATGRYVRTSAQKAGLVMDQIRGVNVARALATLKFSRKAIARDIEKVLRSAIANAQQKEGFGGDVDELYVSGCWANQGPSMKRVRPAPMGRAFRVVKRTAHLTVTVSERAPRAVAGGTGDAAPAGRRTRRAGASASRTPAKAKAKARAAAKA
jgi:large subunit ribosomal protein L22